jgi:hypothetical protein
MYGSQATESNPPASWSLMDNHGPHDMMNLWEGNICEMFGSDGYFGGSSHGTVLRNYFTGVNPISGNTTNPIIFNRLSYYYNLVGNVLGSSTMNPTSYETVADPASPGAIYRLGYPNIGNGFLEDQTGNAVPGGMTYPDAKVESTLMRWGNYDYYNDATRWEASEIPSGVTVPSLQTVPDSYLYTAKPSWFGSTTWPPIGPEVTGGTGDSSGHVHKIPAQVRFEAL